MANTAHPQSNGTHASSSLIYTPPPSTSTHALNTSLFAPSSSPQIRFVGNASSRSHTRVPKPIYPERYNQRYTLPSGIEEQPF
ncbi:MAG TPA: hypothetical protein VKU38_17620 [Ktedonobacteraceae bacterium]|nr:hypothetical protein [Ktedonobacteraceae bacterium]